MTSSPQRGDSMGATENAGFNAKVQQNLELLYQKQHKSLQTLQPVYSLLVVWHVNFPTRSTQPCIPPGLLNRVPASAGFGLSRV